MLPLTGSGSVAALAARSLAFGARSNQMNSDSRLPIRSRSMRVPWLKNRNGFFVRTAIRRALYGGSRANSRFTRRGATSRCLPRAARCDVRLRSLRFRGSSARALPSTEAADHSFDVVSVGIVDKPRVVVLSGRWPWARCAVVATSGSKCGAVELRDLLAIGGLERKVNSADGFAYLEVQSRGAGLLETDIHAGPKTAAPPAKRGEGGLVEVSCLRGISDGNADVIQGLASTAQDRASPWRRVKPAALRGDVADRPWFAPGGRRAAESGQSAR